MPRMIFVNLPVTDLARSIAFYEAAGATQDPKFSDDKSMCMVLSDTIYVMLLTREKFAEFTRRPIADAHATVQTLLCLSADSRDHVDSILESTGAAGGTRDPNTLQDYGFMYNRSVEEFGHVQDRRQAGGVGPDVALSPSAPARHGPGACMRAAPSASQRCRSASRWRSKAKSN